MKKILYTVLIFSILFCSKPKPRDLAGEIADYTSGKIKTTEKIETSILRLIAKKELSLKGTSVHSQCIYAEKDGSLEVVYPVKGIVSFPGIPDKEKLSLNDDMLSFVSSRQILLNNLTNRTAMTVDIDDNNHDIKAIFVLNNNQILYVLDRKLYSYDVMEGEHTLYIEKQFRSPYSKLYYVNFSRKDRYLSLSIGVAGSYYINIIDTINKKVLVSDISACSSKQCLLADSIYYISGSSGNWRLSYFNILTKKKKYYKTFKDLVDIDITPNVYVFEDSKGVWISDFTETIKVPFEYKIAGKIDHDLVVQYKDLLFVVDAADLFNELRSLKEKLPLIFE